MIQKKPFYKDNKTTLYQGNCLKLLKEIPSNSIDMIFADPPYFLSNGGISCRGGKVVLVNKADWDKSQGFEKDFRFTYEWIAECWRILRPHGTIWISGTRHNIFMVGTILQQIGFNLLNDITWFKPNAPPNLSCKYFAHSHETLLWARKYKNKTHRFNYDVVKQWEREEDIFKNVGKQMRSVWSIPLTPQREKTYGKHPTQKPLELLKRVILSSTCIDDIILDPFNGSGTTGVVARENGRKYIGIDLEKEYLSLTLRRLGLKKKVQKETIVYKFETKSLYQLVKEKVEGYLRVK